jgi:hypothetical protein
MTNATNTGRAIDRHESAIVDVLDLIDSEVVDNAEAFRFVASINGLTTERLQHLTRVWCAIAGIEAPK